MSTTYSMWPVIAVPYNLPPWKCMKQTFSMMTLLIPGPQAPGRDIDVYLLPMIDELKELWEHGVQTYDYMTKSMFNLRAAVIWTINDFPTYGNLSGWSTKGFLACPVCNMDTTYCRLRSKIGYIGHHRYLPMQHSWRKNKADFDGHQEMRPPPREFSGEDILEQFDFIRPCKPGKHPNNKERKRKRNDEELNWTKKSIFFQLDYWPHLKIRHNLDVMHIEKNICDSIIGTLFSIDKKSKDTYKARLDLKDMKIRKELWLKENGSKFDKPPSEYALKPHDRRAFCQFLKSVKFPDGYAANISRNVNLDDGKLSGLKSHDCHVFLQHLLSVGVRKYLKKSISAHL